MPTQLCRSPESDVSPALARARFIRTPTDLFLNDRSRIAPAIYAAVARLCEIAKGPVEISRTDLALWCDAEREDAIGGAIERAIWDLTDHGWLIQSPGAGKLRKRRLLAAWGRGRDGAPQPWCFNRPDRGKPKAVTVVQIPLALFDSYLGRLHPNPDGPATVERYFDHALLDYDDIGLYAERQIGLVQVSLRLCQLGLIDEQGVVSPPPLDELLTQAAQGTLVTNMDDGTLATVRLLGAGEARLRKGRTQLVQTSFDAPHGSADDPCNEGHGSDHGSQVSQQHLAPGCGDLPLDHTPGASWDLDGINKQIKCESPPYTDLHAHASEVVDLPPFLQKKGTAKSPQPTTASKSPALEHNRGNRELNHEIADLDPMIAALHQSLNQGRDIPTLEWIALRVIEQTYGRDSLLQWQLRAAGAGRSEILLAYYLACAGDQAFACAQAHPRRPPPVLDDQPSGIPPPSPAPHRRPESATEPPRVPVQLDPQRERLVQGIEVQMQAKAHFPEKLVAVPLALLVEWRAIAGHPGLQKYRDPIAYVISMAAAGKAPPPLDELNTWVEQHFGYWEARSIIALWEMQQRADSGEELERGDDEAEEQADGAALLCAMMREWLPRRCWPLLNMDMQITAHAVQILCPSWATYNAIWDIQGLIRDGMFDLGLPEMLCIVAPDDERPAQAEHVPAPFDQRVEVSGQPPGDMSPFQRATPVPNSPIPPDPPSLRPDWIDSATWEALPPLARAALAGSTSSAGGISGGNLVALKRCFPDLLPELIAAAQARASPDWAATSAAVAPIVTHNLYHNPTP